MSLARWPAFFHLLANIVFSSVWSRVACRRTLCRAHRPALSRVFRFGRVFAAHARRSVAAVLVRDLINPEKREAALLELSKKREEVPDLAVLLWYSYGTITALLQEIIAIYSLLSPPAKLKAPASNRQGRRMHCRLHCADVLLVLAECAMRWR